MKRFITVLSLSLATLFMLLGNAFSAQRLLNETFDDQKIDQPSVGSMTVYKDFLYGPTYEGTDYDFNAVGRGGSGYCFSGAQDIAAYIMWRYNQTWPTDEMYVSFWQRFANYTYTDPNENFKVFYPHWGSTSYHVAIRSDDGIITNMQNSQGQWGDDPPAPYAYNAPNQMDGNWHHYEFYLQFSTGHAKFWYDGNVVSDTHIASGTWDRFNYYLTLGSADAEEAGIFLRQYDDWEVWDGMPTDYPPGDVTDFTAQAGDSEIVLNWTNPTDSDFKGTLIRYSTGADPYPATRTEGTYVCDREAVPGSSDSFTVTGLENGIKYNFSAFTHDKAGNYSETAHVSATPAAYGPPPDTIDPTVSITQPTSEDAYSTNQNAITLSGTASDNVGVTSVTWTNSQSGSGTASGIANWTISNISLQAGNNVITTTAHDAAGNTGTDTLTVTYSPPTGTYTEEFGSATSADYPGTLQDTFININEENASTYEYLNTFTWPTDQVANAIILKANLAVIPYGAQVQSATFYLYMNSMGGDGGDDLYDISAHKIINVDPELSQCTGYTYDGTNSWTPNDIAYNGIPLAQADIALAEDIQAVDKTYGYKSWNVTNMVRDWVANQNANFGVLLNSDSSASSNSNRFFASSEASDPNQRPKLVVTYITGSEVNAPPTIGSFTTTPSSLNNPGETITFNVSATDPDGDFLTYTINFGDGTASESGSEVVHTYASAGTYTADVTVDDGHGNIVGESLQIAVNDVPPAKPTGVTVK